MKAFILLILATIQLALSGCNRSLGQNMIDEWFYGLPVYDSPDMIVSKILSDGRFQLITLPDTTKDNYIYKGFIEKQKIPSFIGQPDSAAIDFTRTKFYLGKKIQGKSQITTQVKLLEIEYFFSDSVKIDALYKRSYKDLKTMLSDDHDITESFNGIEYGVGKDIVYVKNSSGSQAISIIKKTHQNGLKCLELTFKFGDNYRN